MKSHIKINQFIQDHGLQGVRHLHAKSGSSHNPDLNQLFFEDPSNILVQILRENLTKEESLEYEKEYGFFDFSILTLLVILFTVYLSNVMSKVTLSLDGVLNHFSNGKTIVLFTHLNTCLFNSKLSSEKELTNKLVSGEVKKGRVL